MADDTPFGSSIIFDSEEARAEFERVLDKDLAERLANPCPACGGSGTIYDGPLWHGCMACGGSGLLVICDGGADDGG